MSFLLHRGCTVSCPLMLHEVANGIAYLKNNMEIENKATTDHLLCARHPLNRYTSIFIKSQIGR